MGQLWGQGSEPVMDVKKGGRDRVWEARRGQSFDQFHSLFGLLELTVMGAKLKASYILEKIPENAGETERFDVGPNSKATDRKQESDTVRR